MPPSYSVSCVVLGDQAGLDQPGHVGLERQVHEVGRQAGLDRPRLVARGAERVLERDVGALLASRLNPGSRSPSYAVCGVE